MTFQSSSDSCLVQKVLHYVDLSEHDKILWARLEETEEDFRKDQILRRTGDRVEYLYVIKHGWLYSFSVLDDGRRQVLKIHYPGDIVDLSDLPLQHAAHDVKCVTAACLCPFPKDGLDEVFRKSPRMTALLFSFAILENMVLLNRIRAMGRLSAYERLCYFLLEITDRLHITDRDVDAGFRLPLTQADIADAVGLTNVTVSKTLAKMEQDGLIEREGSRMRLLDVERMREIAQVRSSPAKIDIEWFPKAL
jgi:CRP-like cAMP-binding protein